MWILGLLGKLKSVESGRSADGNRVDPENTDVLKAVDWVGTDGYPYWQGATPNQSPGVFWDSVNQVRQVVNNVKVRQLIKLRFACDVAHPYPYSLVFPLWSQKLAGQLAERTSTERSRASQMLSHFGSKSPAQHFRRLTCFCSRILSRAQIPASAFSMQTTSLFTTSAASQLPKTRMMEAKYLILELRCSGEGCG